MSDSNTYFLADNVDSATQVVEQLRAHGLKDEAIGTVFRYEHQRPTTLPEADLTEESDVRHALARGAGLGTASGLLAGLTVMAFPPAGVVVGGAAVAAITAGGAAVGTWSATMIGVSEQSPLVEQFRDALDEDKILVLATIEPKQQQEVLEAVAAHLGLENSRYGVIT